ncbi:hypothetical protein M595_2878 [Lyngbya aestuarii BL J]|uniref:Uncharacterized protein n=1 Tax=Lyngbya aestuarii BL J TaxID=1348334 RepID=U7QGL8_9CYAN|nr:hypothetical protein M595_2878 [Lyngbya aestuarii BL J]
MVLHQAPQPGSHQREAVFFGISRMVVGKRVKAVSVFNC